MTRYKDGQYPFVLYKRAILRHKTKLLIFVLSFDFNNKLHDPIVRCLVRNQNLPSWQYANLRRSIFNRLQWQFVTNALYSIIITNVMQHQKCTINSLASAVSYILIKVFVEGYCNSTHRSTDLVTVCTFWKYAIGEVYCPDLKCTCTANDAYCLQHNTACTRCYTAST